MMKKLILTLAIMLSFSVCNAQNAAFESFVRHFGKSAAFAYVSFGKHEVLLVSHEVFGEDESDELSAVATSIFALDSDGKIVSLGSISSKGTLYPISISDGKLMVAGHHFVSVYGIRGEEKPELEIVCHEQCEPDNHSPELSNMFRIFENAKPVRFSYVRF